MTKFLFEIDLSAFTPGVSAIEQMGYVRMKNVHLLGVAVSVTVGFLLGLGVAFHSMQADVIIWHSITFLLGAFIVGAVANIVRRDRYYVTDPVLLFLIGGFGYLVIEPSFIALRAPVDGFGQLVTGDLFTLADLLIPFFSAIVGFFLAMLSFWFFSSLWPQPLKSVRRLEITPRASWSALMLGMIYIVLGFAGALIFMANRGGILTYVSNTSLRAVGTEGKGIVNNLSKLMRIGLWVLAWELVRRNARFRWTIVWFLFLLMCPFILLTGNRYEFIGTLFGLIFLHVSDRQVRVPIVWSSLVALLILAVAVLWSVARADLTNYQVAWQWLSDAGVQAISRPFWVTDYGFLVVKTVPQQIRFLNGWFHVSGILSIVPRQIWPSKPLTMGNTLFTALFFPNLVGRNVLTAGLFGSMWLDLGWWGIMFGGILVGIYLFVLERIRAMSIRNPMSITNLVFLALIHGLFRMYQDGLYNVVIETFMSGGAVMLVAFLTRRRTPSSEWGWRDGQRCCASSRPGSTAI